jgi:hypothetical protein
MNNMFDFSYFVPTPDTTANCALSRWNDSLMGLSDFLKAYMSSRQSLEFGFSRNLNIAELLNLAKSTVKDSDEKNDYVINYLKYGDLKANVCGFEIPLVDFYNPFLQTNWMYDHHLKKTIDISTQGCVLHVVNFKDSGLTQAERLEATINGFNSLIYDIENEMTDASFSYYFGNSSTRQQRINACNREINKINSMSVDAKNYIFGYSDIKELKESIDATISILGNYEDKAINLDNTNIQLYRDYCYKKLTVGGYPYSNFYIGINRVFELNSLLNKYFHTLGIDFILQNNYYDVRSKVPKYWYGDQYNKNHIFVYFRFLINEKPTLTPFISHDGTSIPLSKQDLHITYSMFTSAKTSNSYNGQFYNSAYWDKEEENPVYYDADGNAHLMTLENNIDGMGGRDYTIWSSPVQKTENGYQFECCMPLAFYNEATDSYGNEYYATKTHDGIEVGQVMYRVPVVKRMRQNIEEAIVNTHLTKCLNNLVPATNENAEDDETVVLGGVVVDDFTEGLYPVAETQNIASEKEYGEVKVVKATEDVLNLMYHYSETGELDYNNMSMPKNGRAIDMITLFDVLKYFNGDNPVNKPIFLTDVDFERVVTTHADGLPMVGVDQAIYGLKTFKNKVSIDYDSGANPNAYISMSRDNYSSDLSGYSYQLNPTYGPSFYAVRGGLSFSTDDHKFETYVNENTNGSEITNAYRLLDEYGQNARTISHVTAGAEYDYENGVRYQYGKASIEASESTGNNDASIIVRATKNVSEIIVSSDSMDFGVPVVNGSSDGFEFNVNLTHGSSFIKISDPVLPSSEYDQAVGLHVINSSGDNNYAEIQSFVDSAYGISKTGIYNKFSTYYATVETDTNEDDGRIMLLSSYARSDGTYFSRITLTQGNITLSCNYFNDLSKVGELKFDSGNSNVFYLMPSCPNGYKVNLGTSANKFGTVYAETFNGTAEKASKDAFGNNIDDYINSLITFGSGSSGIAPFSLGYSRGNYQDHQLNLSETVANIIGKSMFAGLAFGQVMLAVFRLEQNISEWYSGTKNFTYGYIYDSSETTDNTKLAYYGNLYEFSFGLSMFGRDTTTDQEQYCWSNQFQHSEDVTTHFPRKLTGKWLFLNSIYDYHNSSSTASYMSVGYWVVLVVKYGA